MKYVVEFLKEVKDYKILAWIIILIVLSVIMIYPIIDANFLYYQRVSNRVEILNKVSSIDLNKVESNDLLLDEYNSILDEISDKEENYLNNIFIYNETRTNKIIKFASGAWLFVLVGILIPFSKENRKRKLTLNIFTSLFCFVFAAILGYIGYIIPTIINVIVNVILYIIILIYLAYTIYKLSN